MVCDHRNEFPERRSSVASLSAADENGRLGTDHFHLQRIRGEHPGGNDLLQMNWLHWALLSALFAGLTGVLAKAGGKGIVSNLAKALRPGLISVFPSSIALSRG